MIGKAIRLERIMNRNTGRTVIIPMDHGFTLGQIEGLGDMPKIIGEISDGGANAIVLHKGMVKAGHRKHGRDIGLIVHLSASTALNPDPNDKVIVCSVEEAIALGADAVSIHINLGAPQESKMIEEAGRISKECTKWGMPLLIMIYPRGEGIDPRSPVAIGHCVRVAEEIGADIIKTSYTGDPETFKKITSACSVPVIVAGGEKGDDIETLKSVRDAVKAGCAGVALGRNSFQRENPKEFIRALCSVVHEDKSPKDALRK
ncbi:2-amino-3,7-dideoxy-D-threo-hept-6-ulosonate synthase [Methanomicrobium antiquum]|uniref:2-amino-3,7-dideoxy-D-threo-hept-6-ulosonate synthase n=1 Tax=Methanomicrobium antiquum TaxID=487686 RepID=A0AAF0JMW9_9EURY|nr:2-amino-3,7-dideoxy-D-threo-hept-6-ulosonate synthase [Methanomicrobium antiquum]MDD3977452.1 2-amino-3,7-dideoxy-D-threo-hept-6-ulosonate synthase [Methanomicrobium sp.]WFN37000.1 2-amino-3,7-dideoxy-D-threo-hept-6-ulosonate synthase [Methanomicrobium antiquum]